MLDIRTLTPRRIAAGLALITLTAAGAATLSQGATDLAATDRAAGQAAANDAWLDQLDGKYRQLFDAPAAAGGIPLVHVLNYYDTYNKAYNVPDKEVDGVLTFYGSTTFHGLSDAMWAKYGLGEFVNETDPATGKPALRNPWRAAPVVLGMELRQASIESLQQRGATFIICNNALTIFAGLVAQKKGLDAGQVYADMKANILPGVTLVPAMVIAIEKAQARGLSYHRQ